MASVSTTTGCFRTFGPRLFVLVLAALAVFFVIPDNHHVVETLGSRLGIQTSGGKVGNSVVVEDQGLHSYLPYHPNKTIGFAITEKVYISDIYVPYDTIVEDVWAKPYEIRWPDEDLPGFAFKAESDAWKPVPKGKHVCFVSVGKTAGSSLSGLLGFRLHGPEVYFIPNGLLPHYTTHMLHGDINNCADDTPYYLFTVRNPLQRLQSAFPYDRDTYGWRPYAKPIYKNCGFKTLNILAAEGLADDGKAPESCKQLAYDLVRGYGYKLSYHLFCNYHYYYNVSFAKALQRKDSQILVIRTEHMENDWNTAERAIGGEKNVDLNIPHLNTHDKSSKDKELSEKSQVLLCDALCEEIQIYKRLLREAVNLNKRDYTQSLAELQESCPLQASADSCS